MKIAYFTKHTALNGGPILNAFIQGCQKLGVECVENSLEADAAVVWSMLWQGRMSANREIFQHYRQQGRPVFVLEVGMLHRERTWKLGINGTTADAVWTDPFDNRRWKKLNLVLEPWKSSGKEIVIMGQRTDSSQWPADVDPVAWHTETIKCVRRNTDRPVLFRPHPRQKNPFAHSLQVQMPRRLPETYDGYDFSTGIKNAWAVVNFNSGPGTQSIIAGVPAFVHRTSLAAPVANLDLSQLEYPLRPDREEWINNLAHTEWTREELADGIPQQHLLKSNVFHSSRA